MPLIHRWRNCALLFLALALASEGCSDKDTGTGPVNVGPCTEGVTISVSGGTTPRFTWTPACKPLALLVEGDGGDTWYVRAVGDGFASGVTYGTAPTGTTVEYGPEPLQTGAVYDVILSSGAAGTWHIVGIKQFTP